MSDIKKQITSGVFYTAIAKYAGIVISIVITGVLSRLLTPEDFGTIVPITILVSFFTILGDIGIGPAIIQSKELSKENINSIFSFTVFVGLFLAGIFFFSSWNVADLYKSDVFITLCQLLSVSLFFSCANIVPNALLYKAKRFRFLAIRSLIVQISAGVVAILSAYLGAGLYALVVQSMLASICMFTISYFENPLKIRIFKFDPEPLKKIRNFSSYQFLFNILNYFSVNLDKLVISKYLGATQLGYYDKSYKLMQMPLQNIPFIITPVMHPIFCELQNDLTQMRIYYSKVVRLLAFIGFPLSVLLYFAGHDIIFIIFGTQWEPSVRVFQILSLSVGFQIILATSGSIFQSAGNTKLLFLCGVLSTFTIVVATLTGLFVFSTIEALGAFLSCAYTLNFLMCFSIMYCRLFKVRFTLFLKQLGSPLLLSAILAILLWLIYIPLEGMNVLLSFTTKGCLTAFVMILYIQLSHEYDLFAKIHSIFRKFKRY